MTSANLRKTPIDGASGGAPASNPELTVRRLVAGLRATGLHPAVASNFVAEGVLHDVGWALWEAIPNPNSGAISGGGYTHALFHVSPVQYGLDNRSPMPPSLSEREVRFLKGILESPAVNLVPSEWHEYANGATSVCTQQMVFSPISLGAGSFTFYPYPELQTLVNLAGSSMRVYANIGMANNDQFWTGEYEFNRTYPIKTNRITNPPRLNRIQPNDFVSEPRFATPFAVFPGEDRAWPHLVYDVTNAEVVRLCMESIRHMARTYPSVRLILGGEAGIEYGGCSGEVLHAGNCNRCAPITNFSSAAIAGFQKYMQRIEPNPLRINMRWQIPSGSAAQITNHGQIAIATTHHCPYYLALRDFQAFQRLMMHELHRHSYRAAKQTRPSGTYAYLTAGTDAMERGWLESDAAVSLQYYIAEENQLPGPNGWSAALHTVAAAARLSGKPASMAISSPAGRPLPPPGFTTHYGQPVLAPWAFWYLETFRATTPDLIYLFLREILTVHSLQIGYMKAFGFSLKWWPPNVAAVRDMFGFLDQERLRSLRFSGPYQRVAVHYGEPRYQELRGDIAREVVKYLDQERVPHAVFSSSRVLGRPLAQDLLRRSVVVVPFHDGLHEDVSLGGRRQPLIAHYLDLYRSPSARGLALIVARPTDVFFTLLPVTEFTIIYQSGHLRLEWRNGKIIILVFVDTTGTHVMSVLRPYLRSTVLRVLPVSVCSGEILHRNATVA